MSRWAIPLPGPLDDFDRRATRLLGTYSYTILRVALGVVFLWFGALKLAGESPVEQLVRDTLFWFPEDWVVPAVGVLEVIIGAGLLLAIALRVVLLLFWAQILGTFLVFLLRPEDAFRDGNPLLLTTEGEFVVKNLVLFAAGLVVGSHVRRRGRWGWG